MGMWVRWWRVSSFSWMLRGCNFGNPASRYSFSFCFSALLRSTFSVDHLSRGPIWSSWWPFTCLQYHIRGYLRILRSINDTRSKWLGRHDYLVSLYISFFIVFRPSNTNVIATSGMLNFRLIYSTMDTTWNMRASSLLYASWSLGCPRILLVAAIRCVAYYFPPIIISDGPQYSLWNPLLTAMDDPSLSADDIWVSEYFLNERGGIHRVVVEESLGVIPGVWKPVDFTVD